jgi:hypothetical protein
VHCGCASRNNRRDLPDNDELEAYKLVIGPIVLAKTPLRPQDLKYFLGRAEEEVSIVSVLLDLSSVTSTATAGDFIHVSHLCFTEFIDPHGLTDAPNVLSFTETLITG